MKPYQPSADSEHHQLCNSLGELLYVAAGEDACLSFPIASSANKGKGTPGCLALIHFFKCI